MTMKNTIQITPEEDREILALKERMQLPSKKAVVMEGLRALREILRAQQRRRRLQGASQLTRDDSQRANREWARVSTAVKAR